MPKKVRRPRPPRQSKRPLLNLNSWLRPAVRRHRWALVVLLGTFGLYFITLFPQMLVIQNDSLWAGHVHIWGDWSLHIGMANIFAFKAPQDWFAYHPYFSGGKFTYGFLTNMISGLLMRAGVSLPNAFVLPSIFYALVLLLGMYAVFYLVLNSKKASLTAITLFFCSSGLGFLRFIPDAILTSSWQPLKDYSRLENYSWLAGNWVNGMLVPQRAFLLGMALAVWVIALVVFVNKNWEQLESQWRKRLLLLAGVLVGILPITHMHSFIVLVIAMGVVCAVQWRRWRELAFFVVPAGVVSSVLYKVFISGGIENPEFMKIRIGWAIPQAHTLSEALASWLTMWWEIWGIMLPVALVGAWLIRKYRPLIKYFLWSFSIVFLLGNIIQFQPILWDNSKLFMWAYFGFSALATVVVQRLWRRRAGWRGAAVVLFLLLTLTGVMELLRLQQVGRNAVMMATNEEIQLGQQIREKTAARDVFLTQASHNTIPMMWGVRPIVLGYPGWALNFGFLHQQREADIPIMYKGGAEAEELLKKYQVRYVLIGPGELYDLEANEEYFAKKYLVVIATENYRVYEVR